MSMLLTAKALHLKVGNPLRKLVLVKLADNANDDGVCFPSVKYIADACEISETSVKDHIKALISMGLVTKKERKTDKGNTSNLYILHLEQSIQSGGANIDGGRQMTEGGSGADLGGGSGADDRINHSINQSINHKKTSQKKSHAVVQSEVSLLERCFEQFWKAGMTKVNRSKAFKSFKSAYENCNADYPLSLESFTKMLVDDVTKRLRLRQFGFDVLHPTTYLNNCRWLDDYPKPACQSGSGGPFIPDDEGNWAEGMSITLRGS
ncbi:helix-turn-helix domain-containing protein [Glaesserella parasuis]|uniref:helix-turn-helix domain-containing protein n=1 Tax=Glaesserella parasuis TaxID=738 RepID=UPI0013654E2F|nr:helix-turn-helix domain-containing protein [Glaesserella parasuis]MDG6230279.1 helix-turn-helix domain-containing protein [Glaesserella parasuis]MWQ13781.1 helix-turn-helix domain-containing protein [Glaesserella parasuis]